MRTLGLPVLVFMVLFSAALLTIWQTNPPAPLPANAAPAEFSAERALEHIRVLAEGPRLTGSAEFETARLYVLDVLTDLGLETQTQHSGALRNTLGWIPGRGSSDIVLLTAHLDTVAGSPGAADDASGVAVLLETARALMSNAPPENTVMFLFTDFEEGGMVGARAFIAHHPWAQDVRIVIGFDAGGSSGPGVLSATSADNGWLIQQLARANPYFTGSSAISSLAESSTDFGRAFKGAGFSGYEFDLYWEGQNLHTPGDTIENLNLSSLQHQGFHALSLARHLGDLEQLKDPRHPDAVYFSVLRQFTVDYSSVWTVPLAIAVSGVFYRVLAIGLKRDILTWPGIGSGALTLLVGLLLAPLPNLLLESRLPGLTSLSAGRSLDQPGYVILIVLAALALTVLWYALSRRISSARLSDRTVGALVPLWAAMAGTSIAFPALSYAFAWPLLLSLLACGHWFNRLSRPANENAVIAGLLISGAANIIIVGPTVLLGLFDQTSLTLLLLGSLCGFLVPQIYLMLGFTIREQERNLKEGAA